MKLICSTIKFLMFLLYFCSMQTIESTCAKDPFYTPINHPNGVTAWSGDEQGCFYHDNYSIVWEGLENPNTPFSYKNGQNAWDGFLYQECKSHPSSAIVYHMNGNKAWRGVSADDYTYFYCNCAIYHENGGRIWSGFLAKESYYAYVSSSVYHGNGTLAWRGAKREDLSFSYAPAFIYHANGAVAWRGAFAKDKSSVKSCGVYYDNGQLAWGGKRTDPMYDIDGNILIGRTNSINLPLGDNSFLQVHTNGTMYLFISLGSDSFLRFSNQDENPELCMTLGSGYRLLFSTRTASPARLQIYDRTFLIGK